LLKSMEASDALANIRCDDVKGSSRSVLEDSFNQLLVANRQTLTRLVSCFANSRPDREDLLQDIAIALWRALPQFRGECAQKTFLYRIAHNRCIAFLARNRSLMTRNIDECEVQDHSLTAEIELSQREQRDHLRSAIRRLPITYRQVLLLVLEGLSYAEISEVLGIPESNVGVRLNRARQLLKDHFRSQK